MADAHLRASLTLDTNLEEAVRKASEGLTNIEGQVAKSQDRLKKIIEKGDPFYALKKQQEREIAEVEKHVAKDARLRETGELAKAQIVEKFAKKRQQIEENVARSIERAQNAHREGVGKLEQKLNAARGVMDAFGASSSTALGQVTAGAADMAQAFAAGGAAGLALTGFTTLVYKLGTAWAEAATATAKAKIALTTDWEDSNAAVRAMINSAKDDVLRRRDRLAGVSADTILGQEILGAASEQDAARRSNVSAIQARIDANNAALDPLLAQAKAFQDKGNEKDLAKLATVQTKIDPIAQAIAADTALLRDAKEALAAAEKNVEAARLLKEQLDDTGAAEEKARKDKQQAKDVVAGRLPNVYAALDKLPGAKLDNAVDLLSEGLQRQTAQEQADIDAGNDRAQRDAGRLRVAQEASAAKLLETNKQKAEQAAEAWASAGVSAAGQFASAFKSFLDSKDPTDLFGGIIRAAAGILGSLGGVGGIVGGGALGILGGFFEKGGVPYALHLPQGRNGLAVMPGLNFDAKPAWLHKGEVVMPEHVVNDTFGGLPEAARVAAGGGLRASAQTIAITNYTMAFDAPSLDRVWGRAEGVQRQRFTNRQGGAMQNALRSAVLTPRSA